jgi:hypothetical protein
VISSEGFDRRRTQCRQNSKTGNKLINTIKSTQKFVTMIRIKKEMYLYLDKKGEEIDI